MRSQPWTIYVLKLENDKWYVGISRNVQRRYREHCLGMGAKWTKLHRPLQIFETRELQIKKQGKACIREDAVTHEYAALYGWENVRGGGYCTVDYTKLRVRK